MSAAVGTQITRPNTGGCLKCGEQGHWARDCQAPREKWLARNGTQDNPATQRQAPGTGSDPAAAQGEEQEK